MQITDAQQQIGGTGEGQSGYSVSIDPGLRPPGSPTSPIPPAGQGPEVIPGGFWGYLMLVMGLG